VGGRVCNVNREFVSNNNKRELPWCGEGEGRWGHNLAASYYGYKSRVHRVLEEGNCGGKRGYRNIYCMQQ
jgi:hypothetical protein